LAGNSGLEVESVGVRADILPGGTKAKKAAEANRIAHREETARDA